MLFEYTRRIVGKFTLPDGNKTSCLCREVKPANPGKQGKMSQRWPSYFNFHRFVDLAFLWKLRYTIHRCFILFLSLPCAWLPPRTGRFLFMFVQRAWVGVHQQPFKLR